METKMLRKTIAAIMALTIIGSSIHTGFIETILSSGSVITANAETFDEWVAKHLYTYIAKLGPTYEPKYHYANHLQHGADAVCDRQSVR